MPAPRYRQRPVDGGRNCGQGASASTVPLTVCDWCSWAGRPLSIQSSCRGRSSGLRCRMRHTDSRIVAREVRGWTCGRLDHRGCPIGGPCVLCSRCWSHWRCWAFRTPSRRPRRQGSTFPRRCSIRSQRRCPIHPSRSVWRSATTARRPRPTSSSRYPFQRARASSTSPTTARWLLPSSPARSRR